MPARAQLSLGRVPNRPWVSINRGGARRKCRTSAGACVVALRANKQPLSSEALGESFHATAHVPQVASGMAASPSDTTNSHEMPVA
jgi:hypothetical protein